MFGLGMGELIVILAIALIFLGPKRLPDVASSLGKAIRSFRKATRDLTDQLEIDDEVKQPLRELQSALRDDPVQPVAVVKPAVAAKSDVDAAPAPIAKVDGAPAAAPAPAAPSPAAKPAAAPPPPLDAKKG